MTIHPRLLGALAILAGAIILFWLTGITSLPLILGTLIALGKSILFTAAILGLCFGLMFLIDPPVS